MDDPNREDPTALISRQDIPILRDIDFTSIRKHLKRFFEEPFGFDLPLAVIDEKRMARMIWSPDVEATESPTEYLVTAQLPGISPEQVDVHMAEGTLTLKGTKAEEKTDEDAERTWHLWERHYGSFQRTFRFPLPVNEAKVAAEFTDGILRIGCQSGRPRRPTRGRCRSRNGRQIRDPSGGACRWTDDDCSPRWP